MLSYLDARLSLLRQGLDQTNSLVAQGQLPEAELSSAGLKITPLDDNVPKEAHALREDVYSLLPHVKITDLLLEVNRWTDFTRYFVHLKTGESAKDPALLLTAILADATNMGLVKMAESCPGTSLSKLSWLVA
jgi:Tn3 transposase DDE domain